jgi:integrase
MARKSITDAFIRHIKYPKKGDRPPQTTYIDTLERGLALVLVVSYGGTKTFRVLTYRNGKPQSTKLGTYPAMTVKKARAEARQYWENPERFEAQAAVGSFKEVAENWVKRHVEENKLRSEREIKRILANYVYPKWKDRPFLEIRRPQVTELLDGIVDNHGRSQADAVLAIVRGICNWFAANLSEHYISPIVKGMRRNGAKARDRTLNDDELRAVWKAAGDCGTFGALVKTLLLTAQRRKKGATMKWDDLVDGVWTIPTDDREKGTAGKIKLPKLALDIIEAQPRIVGNPYVFAYRGTTAFNAWAQRKQELVDKLPDMPPWVIHDLRRTARSLLSRANVRPDIAERVLGHAIPGIGGVYDRHQYNEQKAEALKQLAYLVETIINPPGGDNVVAMSGRRKE